jgi:alkylation response protein AidB-like acyl-CoA dehydrogenase
MDLRLSEAQEAIRLHAEELGRVLKERGTPGPRARIRELGRSGLLGLGVPEELGGRTGGPLELALVVAELACWNGSLAQCFLAQRVLCAEHLLRAGTQEQRLRWLPGLVSGESVGCWAPGPETLTLENGPPHAEATPRGEDWLLEGLTGPVPNASEADLAIVFARVEGDELSTAFVAESTDPGIRLEPRPSSGMREAGFGELVARGCRLEGERRLGAQGSAATDATALLEMGSVAMAALSVGLGRAALSAARAALRMQEGATRQLAAHQAIQWRIADGATELEAARLLWMRAACSLRLGRDAQPEASIAHLTGLRAAGIASSGALQVLGASALADGSDLERIARDLRHCEFQGGSVDLHRRRVAHSLLQA